MELNNSARRWAFVTGASSGIGEAFARRFAKEGWNIILAARSLDKLEMLASELARAHGVQAVVIQADLADAGFRRRVYDQVISRSNELDCLVNNAGFGVVGEFAQREAGRQLDMIELNVKALVDLTHRFLPAMIKKKQGWIINVSSTACFQPMPYFAIYAATKAFVTSFSEALWVECRGHGITVLNLCPGRTKTNFGHAAGQKTSAKDFRLTQTAEEVVEQAFRAMKKNQPTTVTNPLDNTVRFFERFLPRRFVVQTAGRLAKYMGYHT